VGDGPEEETPPSAVERLRNAAFRESDSCIPRVMIEAKMRGWTSKAIVGDGRGAVDLTSTTVEAPGKFEVAVRIRAAGLCHTDYDSTFENRQPYVLGHEGAGEVLSVGEGVEDLQTGQPVLLTWAIACGKCFQCVRGNAVHCEVLGRVHGHAHYGSTRVNGDVVDRFFHLGTMSNVAIVRREALVPLPESIPFDEAAILGCGVMTGYGSVVNAARVLPGSTVTVIGCGGVGLNVIQGARIAGAAEIMAVDVRQEKLSLARRMGATRTLVADPADRGLIRAAAEVRSLFGGRGTDYAFECTAVPDLAFAPLAMVRDGGSAVQVSGVEQEVLGDLSLFEWDKTYLNPLYGKCQPSIDFPRLFTLYERGVLELEPMITRRYSLEDYAAAFDDLRQSRNCKAVFIVD
jgi:S-(hydroxymethyl)glutathione dehydrogenase / alcohol dehydrogenase